MNVAIFGAGHYGKKLGEYIITKGEDKLVAYIDNNIILHGKMIQIGEETIKIYSLNDIKYLDLDLIIISLKSSKHIASIKEQLKKVDNTIRNEALLENVELFKNVLINTTMYQRDFNRISFLRDFAKYAEETGLVGSVAECGVYVGDFAYYINKYFYDRKFYLIDTFEGFSRDDVEIEKSLGDVRFIEGHFAEEENQFRLNIDLVDIINKKMPYIENCRIKKGYFPDSVYDIQEMFCFVNLDMDLYKPMYEGINFFYPKMCKNGVILLHDYYNEELPGVKKAVEDFEKERGEKFYKLPAGDECSIAIIKV